VQLTKKRLAIFTMLMTVIYFVPLINLPDSIVGTRGENLMLFVPKVFFLSLTAAISTGILLVLILKRNYVKEQISTFLRYRHLLKLLVKRDFIMRYRKSVLGILWSLLNPLLTMLVITMVFSFIFKNQVDNFPVYLLSGQIIFGFFSESTTQSMQSILSSESIIRKIYVPKYIFPMAKVFSSLLNLLFSFLAFLLVFIITGANFSWTMLLLPIPIIYTFVFSLGISMLLSSMAVFFRDLTYLYSVFITLLTYLTPLFYPVSILPEKVVPVIGFNPMYHYVDYARSVALYSTVPDLWSNIVCLGFALAALCIGTFVFMNQQEKYILYM